MPSKGDRKARYNDFYQCQSLFLTLDGSMPGYATYINDQENQAANQNKQYDRVGKFACQYINPHKQGKSTLLANQLPATLSGRFCLQFYTASHHPPVQNTCERRTTLRPCSLQECNLEPEEWVSCTTRRMQDSAFFTWGSPCETSAPKQNNQFEIPSRRGFVINPVSPETN